jgi:WD40 repeat protein
MRTARQSHTATLLPSGKILVVGGGGGNGLTALSSCELYDPATGAWTTTGSLTNARLNHTATLLNNGKVLVAGGNGATAAYTSAELYDPTTGNWTPTGRMNALHTIHTATMLPNGKVLVAAGGGNNTAELYDPATGTWTLTGSLTTSRGWHTATWLNGKVLVAGGFNNVVAVLTSAELYDPATGTWTATGSLNASRANHIAALLPNGLVLAAGGRDDTFVFLNSAELYSPATATWTNTGSLNFQRYAHASTLLANGRVLVVGGWGTNGQLASAELFDPATGLWTSTASLHTRRDFHTATLLRNGKVLVTGGQTGNSSLTIASAEIYDPNNPPIARCRDVTKEADANCAASVTAGEVDNGSADPDGDPITLSLSPPGPFLLGTTPVTLIVADNHGSTNTCNATVTVVDTQPPLVVCSVRQSVLWPPNHKLVNVGLEAFAADECSSALAPVSVRVFSNEDDAAAASRGAPDASDIGPGTLKLREERTSHPLGRVYLIVVTATDSSGNLGVKCCTVIIPANQSAAAFAAVEAEATQTSSYCLSHTGAPPPDYFLIGKP